VRIAAFDQLNGVFNRYVVSGSEQEMNMFGHEDEGVDLKSAFAPISVKSFQEEADIVLDSEESSPLPRREVTK
jgi:hypothetical protein